MRVYTVRVALRGGAARATSLVISCVWYIRESANMPCVSISEDALYVAPCLQEEALHVPQESDAHEILGKTGVTADHDKIEVSLFNSSSIFNITLREELYIKDRTRIKQPKLNLVTVGRDSSFPYIKPYHPVKR